MTDRRKKKDILREVRTGFLRREISTREYFEAIYLLLSCFDTNPWEEHLETIKDIVDEEHFDEVRKFIKQNPVLKNIACYDIGQLIHISWSSCCIEH